MLKSLFGRSRALIGIIAFLLVWEAAVRLLHLPEYILPAPSVIIRDGADKWRSLLGAASYTAQPMLLGFVVAVVLGVLIALGIAFSHSVRAVAYPLLVFLQIVPKIAVAPLFIIWFGFGLTPKVLLVFLLSFFPVVVAATTAFALHRAGNPGTRPLHRCGPPAHLPHGATAERAARRCSAASRWPLRWPPPPPWWPSSSPPTADSAICLWNTTGISIRR